MLENPSQDMWPQSQPTAKKSPFVLVILIILALVIGFTGGFYYYRLSHLTPATTSATTPTSTALANSTAISSASPTVSATTSPTTSSPSDAWQESAKKTVDAYLVGLHSTLTPLISTNTKPHFSNIDEYELYLKNLTLTKLNDYLTCVKNYQANHNEIILNANIDGTQDNPYSYAFGDVTINNNHVTVVVNEQFSTPHTVTFYLLKEGDNWLVYSTSELDKIDATKTGCVKS